MMKTMNLALLCLFFTFSTDFVNSKRCDNAPNWLVNGRNPIVETAADGNVVVLSLVTSKSKQFLYHTLDSLDNYGRHYSYVVKQNVRILVINGQGAKLHPSINERFPHIDIYDEPADRQVFKKLKGNAWDVLVYDICGRQQFRYVYPYSWLGFPFLSRAINYAINKYEHICGKCKPLSEYRHLPARVPPTISSAHIPAVVADNDSITPTNTTRKASTNNSTLSISTTSGTHAKNDLQAGKLISPAIATTTPTPRKQVSNDVRDFIVNRLNKYLNKTKYFTDIVTNTPSNGGVVDIESTPSTNELDDKTSEEKSREEESNETDEEISSEVSTESSMSTTQEPLVTTESFKSTSETEVVSSNELNREIREENEKLKRQINKAENLILKNSEEGKKEEDVWEKDLVMDFILQSHLISNKKK